jgi:hypothetical protein
MKTVMKEPDAEFEDVLTADAPLGLVTQFSSHAEGRVDCQVPSKFSRHWDFRSGREVARLGWALNPC